MEVHRRTIFEAIQRAQKSPKWAAPSEGDPINADASYLILRTVEKEFDLYFGSHFERPKGKDLYRIVDQICFETGLGSGRRRLYQLICMQYYTVRKERINRARKLWAERSKHFAGIQANQNVA
jgi:hypothetical protein